MSARGPVPKNPTQGWREFGGKRHYYRSSWESNYGRYLEFMKQKKLILDWEHEPKTFWFNGIKRGIVSYLPDFMVINMDGSHYWVEVKGYWDAKSQTKTKRFAKYFPDENLKLIDKDWFRMNNPKLKGIISDWEMPCALKKKLLTRSSFSISSFQRRM